MADNQFPVVIIGAGLAGLSAGAHLAAKGVPPLLIDSDWLWAGGRLSGGEPETFEYDGRSWSFTDEHGVHALWGGYANMRAMLERFTDTELQLSSGEEWINRWGRDVARLEAGNAIRSRWIPAPFHYLQLLFHPQIWGTIQPWDFLSLPGFLASILLTVGVDPIKEQKAWDGLMMDDYFYLWTPNLRATFEGLGTNLLAAPHSEITLSGFIAALRFYTMLRRDTWQMSYLPSPSHDSLIQPLVDYIRANGGDLYGGLTAKQLQRTENGWRITVDNSLAQGIRTIEAEDIIIATNAPSAKRLLCNSPDTADQAHDMIFPDGLNNVVVRLWFDAEPRAGTMGGMMTGDFAPDNFFWLHRLYDDYRDWHETTGGSAIELHFYETDLLSQPDRNLIVLATTEVLRAYPELKGHFVHATVRRNSKVHTAFRVPDDKTLHVESRFENIYACGDWVGYDTPSLWMERSVTTGIAAANAVVGKRGIAHHEILSPPPAGIVVQVLALLMRVLRVVLRPIVMGVVALRRRMKSS